MLLERGTFTVFPSKLSTDLGLDHHEQCVLLWICNYTNQNGQCWPSLKKLSHDSGLSLSTVRRSIDSLKDKGILLVEQRHGEDGGYCSNLYSVRLPQVSEGHHPYVQPEQLTKPIELKKKKLEDIPDVVALKEIWDSLTGGSISMGRYAGGVLQLVRAHGIASVQDALRRYINTTPNQFRSMSTFIEKPGVITTEREEVDFERL